MLYPCSIYALSMLYLCSIYALSPDVYTKHFFKVRVHNFFLIQAGLFTNRDPLMRLFAVETDHITVYHFLLLKCLTNQKATDAEKIEKLVF